jgi:hypothetical protein
MARITVQATVNGEHGEWVATSKTKTVQEMIDWMDANRKPNVKLRYLGEYGYLLPSSAAIDTRPNGTQQN